MALLEKYRGTYETAQSAANYIDADGIIKNANKIKAELEEFNNLSIGSPFSSLAIAPYCQ